jgi:hypothetical protein
VISFPGVTHTEILNAPLPYGANAIKCLGKSSVEWTGTKLQTVKQLLWRILWGVRYVTGQYIKNEERVGITKGAERTLYVSQTISLLRARVCVFVRARARVCVCVCARYMSRHKSKLVCVCRCLRSILISSSGYAARGSACQ